MLLNFFYTDVGNKFVFKYVVLFYAIIDRCWCNLQRSRVPLFKITTINWKMYFLLRTCMYQTATNNAQTIWYFTKLITLSWKMPRILPVAPQSIKVLCTKNRLQVSESRFFYTDTPLIMIVMINTDKLQSDYNMMTPFKLFIIYWEPLS